MELRLILRTPDQILPTRHISKYHCFGLRQIQRYLLQFSTIKSQHTLIPSSRPLMICSLFLTCAFSSLILVDVISPHLKWLFLLWSQTFGHPNLIETHYHPIEYMTFMFVFKGHHKYGLNLSYYYDQTFDIALLLTQSISQGTLLQYSAFILIKSRLSNVHRPLLAETHYLQSFTFC